MLNLQNKYVIDNTYTGRFIFIKLNFKVKLGEEAVDISLIKFRSIATF